MSSISLDTLPPEILHRIFAYGSTSNALALSHVSRYFRTVCRNPLLYADIIKNNNGFCYPYNISENIWWRSLSLECGNYWDAHARWALADEKANETYMKWCPSHTLHLTFGQIGTSEILAWLPHLILQRHPIAQRLLEQPRPRPDLEPNFDTTSLELTSRLAFCDVCISTLIGGRKRAFRLQRDPNTLDIEDLYKDSALSAYRNVNPVIDWTVLAFKMSKDIMPLGPFNDPEQNMAGNNGTSPGFVKYTLVAMLVAGMMHRVLFRALDRGEIQKRNPNTLPERYPPSARDIPFPQFYTSNYLPFTTSETHDSNPTFLARHLPVMTSLNFLVDGQWVGYYCYIHTVNLPFWDTMMHSIQFAVSADYADHCAIHSRGEDGCGAFLLFGTVHKRTGWVQMTKQYDNHHATWLWSAVMTPFGLVGCWGSTRECDRGWVWLWKDTWSGGLGGSVGTVQLSFTPDILYLVS